MKHFYTEMDNIILTFNDIKANEDGMEYIRIYFERAVPQGFDYLESSLPALEVKDTAGFTEEEISKLLQYANNNAFLIWEIDREYQNGGEQLAAGN